MLLDVMMPGMSGLEVLKTLRERYSTTELPIIMATANSKSEDIVEALELGANDYVTKPIDFPGGARAHRIPAAPEDCSEAPNRGRRAPARTGRDARG